MTEQAEYLAKLDQAGLKVESDFRNAPSVVKQDAEEPAPQEDTLTNE
jgi:hypothetical protein